MLRNGAEAAGAVRLPFARAGAFDGLVAERLRHLAHHHPVGMHRDQQRHLAGVGHHHIGEVGLAVPAHGDRRPMILLGRFPEIRRVGDDPRGQADEVDVAADQHAADEPADAGPVDPLCRRGRLSGAHSAVGVRIEQAVEVHHEIAHLGIVDRLLRLAAPHASASA